MAHTQPATDTHNHVHPQVFRGIEELCQRAHEALEEARNLHQMNVEDLYSLDQCLAQLNKRAEEALQR